MATPPHGKVTVDCNNYSVMHRREFLTLSASALAASAQTRYPGTNYKPYSGVLPDYLRDLASAAYRARNEAIGKLSTPERIAERNHWCRKTFWQLVGGELDRTPLNARVTGTFERDGYKVEKIVYESRPGLHIPANLYIPAGHNPPFPGVLFQLGHSLNGKAADPYQKCCQGLARLGYLVLAFDTMGQGERTYYPEPGGTLTRLGSADEEHTKPGRQMLLLGDTSSRMQTWDALRSLDYLASHPLVDPGRLGTTGNSGGGTLSMMLACVDDRLTAAAISCPNSENFACADFNPPGSTDDAEQNFIASGPLGFDRWDLLYPLAPKPLLVLVSAKDFFGTYSPSYLSSGWEEYRKLEKVYALLGKPNHLEWADTPLPHGLAHYMRLKIYDFFGRHLKNPPERITDEPRVAPEAERDLWVTESGSVVRSFGSKTPFQLTQRAPEFRHADLASVLKVELPKGPAVWKRLGRVPSTGIHVEAIEVETRPGISIPAWLFVPEKTAGNEPALLIAEPQGRNSRAGEGALYHELTEAGCVVCAVDVRGVGDMIPEVGRGAPRYTIPHAEEEHWAWASLMLGKPMAGQRALDLARAAAALRTHPATKGRRVVLCASGKMTVPALFAAALEREIEALYLSAGLVSFRSVVETEEYRHPFANFVPDLLLHTDLPQVAKKLSPRKMTLAGTVDGGGKRMSTESVRRVYGKAAHIKILDSPAWTAQDLIKV